MFDVTGLLFIGFLLFALHTDSKEEKLNRRGATRNAPRTVQGS